MLVKTKGIVIKQTKFSESGAIVKILTREVGVHSFFVRGIRGGKSGKKAALFQPLTILDLVINFSDKKTLHNIKEISVGHAYQSLTTDPVKRTLLFFIDELLHKCLKEETENTELFDWIQNALIWLDLADVGYVNFHLIFMMQLSLFMGFYPKNETNNENFIFDMQEGKFGDNIPFHPHYVKGIIASVIKQLQIAKFEELAAITMSNSVRKNVLDTLIAYYNLHIPSLGEFKSLDVLSVVLE